MRNFISGLLLLPVLLASCGGTRDKVQLPDPVSVGENGILKAEFIFPGDMKPTSQCHASTIEEGGMGLVAAWFGGTREKNPDVGIWVSRLVDGQWTRAVEVANGVESDSLRFPCWNPVLYQVEDGPLMLFYKVGPNPREWWGMLLTSDDGGTTWSEPRKLGEGRLGHLLGPVKNKPVKLSDGSILCPSSSEHQEHDELSWRTHFEITSDLGKTWEVVGPVNDGVEFDAIQPSVLFYPGGKLQALCRTRQNVISECWSGDNGMTWSRMTSTSLPNPNSGTDAVTLRDGLQMLVYNHTLRKGDFPSGRNMLNVAISKDGKFWKPVLTLERQEGEYSYPAIIQAKNGLVHITYTHNRTNIKHMVLDPEEIDRH